jgi:hypothetical protein
VVSPGACQGSGSPQHQKVPVFWIPQLGSLPATTVLQAAVPICTGLARLAVVASPICPFSRRHYAISAPTALRRPAGVGQSDATVTWLTHGKAT